MTIEEWTAGKYPWLSQNDRLFQILCQLENFNPDLPTELYKPAVVDEQAKSQIKVMEKIYKHE